VSTDLAKRVLAKGAQAVAELFGIVGDDGGAYDIDLLRSYEKLKSSKDFSTFDHLVDWVHNDSDLLTAIYNSTKENPSWLDYEVLDTRARARSLKELAPHASREVRRLIHHHEQLF
jgi:hypothetical protein